MSMNDETFVYGDAKLVGKFADGVVHFVTLVEDQDPFVVVYQNGRTEYSPDYYEILYGDSYTSPFDGCPDAITSPDGKSVLYVIFEKGTYYLYLNDKMVKASKRKMVDFKFSDDSKNYAYFLKEKDGWVAYLNNEKVSKSFDAHSDLIFLPDGSLEFLGGKDGIWHYYSTTRGELENEFLKVGWFFRSPVCDKVGFFCAKAINGTWHVYINNKEILGPFDCMGMPMTVSQSGENYTFTVVRGNEWYVYINDQKVNRAFSVIDFLSFLPNNKDIVCSEVKDDGTRIYINEKLIAGPFEKLGFEMAFSPDCKRVYYSRLKDGKWCIGHTNVDDEKMKFVKDIDIDQACSEVFNLLVSPDLSKIMYSLILEKKDFFNEDCIVYLSDFGTFGKFEDIFFFKISKDGTVVAFTAKEEDGWYLYVNGEKVSGPFHSIPILSFFYDTSIILYKAFDFSREHTLPLSMIYMDGKNYSGQIDKHRIIYVDGEDIFVRERINA
ncbi:MAG: hypothetical protein ACTTKH_05610 [Treponema sp.]